MSQKNVQSQVEECFQNYRIGFIGAGNMALAIAKGFLRKGFSADKIWAVAPSEQNLLNFSNFGCHTFQSSEKLFYNCNADSKTEFYIFLCTKPKIPFETKGFFDFFQSSEYRNSTLKGSVFHLISVMVGVNLKRIETSMKDKTSQQYFVSRIMPNIGCEVNASPTSVAFSPALNLDNKDRLKKLLLHLGNVFDVSESALDSSVGISGSGLAFYCTFLQALADGAVADGLTRNDALEMGAQTAIAMGKLVLEGKHPIVLRDSICSPAGSTITGIQILEESKFSAIVMNTVKQTSAKGRAIAAKLNETHND